MKSKDRIKNTVFAMKILLRGDFAPLGPHSYKIDSTSSNSVDLILVNAEIPFTHAASKQPKSGPNLSGNPTILEGSVTANSVFSLANNHTMDYGEQGLKDTVDALHRHGAKIVGAAGNLEQAEAPLTVDLNGMRIGILARCETQFGIATHSRAGVAPLSPTLYRDIRKLRANCDVVIVSVHGAAEMCPWPSPEWQSLLRSFVDAGANVVHGHHSHIPQGYERYADGLIFYGLGNYVIDPDDWVNTPNALWSLTPLLTVTSECLEFKVETCVIRQKANMVIIDNPSEQERVQHIEYLAKCCEPLCNVDLLTGLWQEFALREYFQTHARWLGFPEGESAVTHLSGRERLGSIYWGLRNAVRGNRYTTNKSTTQQLLTRYHLFACKSHRNALKTALGVLSSELPDMRTETTQRLADEMMPWTVKCRTR